MPSDPNDHRKRAFVSHSGPDDRYVQEFVQLVRSLGFDEVFNDSHTIEPDEKFWERIERGIRECDAFVVILSHASVKSYWVDREVTFAREQGKRVIPIRIDDCELPPSFDGRDVIELKHRGKGQRLSPPRFIHHAAEHFLGREPQLALLDEAWINGTNVLSIIAWGGVGKTALLTEWVQTRFIDHQWRDEGQFKPPPHSPSAHLCDPCGDMDSTAERTESAESFLDAYFDWTFYDQGTRSLASGTLADGECTEARTGSVGDFFEQALVFFGDPDPNLPGKGRRLADLIRQQRSLILLDGLEPLQQPPGHAQAGRLLDPDLRDLLAALAQSNPGLCLITSRQALTDLHALRRTVHTEHELEDLPVTIAIRLLQQLQIKGTDQELAEASEKFGCHALSLTLLGRYLFDAHGGDIARADRIRDLQRADTLTREDRHRTAWRILETYEHWLSTAQADGNPKTLAILRLTGLFDRTATADRLAALRAEPIIPGLTDAICGMADDEWNILLKRLERAHLIKLRESPNQAAPSSEAKWAIDAHPLIREYFAKQLKQTRLEAFKAAHSLLFGYLCNTTEFRPGSLHALQPLYQAVMHGCQCGQHVKALAVYRDRILQRDDKSPRAYFSTNILGAIGPDLSLVAGFFTDKNWNSLLPGFYPLDQAWILNQGAFLLRALGRLRESVSPMNEALNIRENRRRYNAAAGSANNLCEIYSALGELKAAITTGSRAVGISSNASDSFQRISTKATLAYQFFLAGQDDQAEALFCDAHRIQQEWKPEYPVLGSLSGFRYCEFMLRRFDAWVWSHLLNLEHQFSPPPEVAILDDAQRRTQLPLTPNRSGGAPLLITTGLESLSDARILTFRHFVEASFPDSNASPHHLVATANRAIGNLALAMQDHFIPCGLLHGAFVSFVAGHHYEAERLLEEAQQIAERGPMPLYLADVHLHRARLFGRIPADERSQKFPDIDPKAELREARRLIEKHGYWRRKEELEDAEAAAIHW